MNISNMKNMIVLKNLPSNLIEEAIVVLKENKKVRKYQYIDSEKNKNVDLSKDLNKEGNKERKKEPTGNSDYIIKEAENVISNYISNLETKSPKWKNNMKKLEKKYKKSVQLNFILGSIVFISFINLIISGVFH